MSPASVENQLRVDPASPGGPLDDQPLGRARVVFVGHHDTYAGKSPGQGFRGTRAPSDRAAGSCGNSLGNFPDADRLIHGIALRAGGRAAHRQRRWACPGLALAPPHGRLRPHAQRAGQATLSQLIPKSAVIAVGRIPQNHAARNASGESRSDLRSPQLTPGRKNLSPQVPRRPRSAADCRSTLRDEQSGHPAGLNPYLDLPARSFVAKLRASVEPTIRQF